MLRFLFDYIRESFETAITQEDVNESERLHLNNCTTTLVEIRTLHEAVILPCDEDLTEWLTLNVISFFKEVSFFKILIILGYGILGYGKSIS